MTQTARNIYGDAPLSQRSCSLFDIAQSLGVPVVIANRSDANGMLVHSTFGLDLQMNWAELAKTADRLCANGAMIVANIEEHDQLKKLAAPLLANDLRFFVGVPLRDYQARRAGSIAVMASQAFVARRGISVSRLGQLGRQFAGLWL